MKIKLTNCGCISATKSLINQIILIKLKPIILTLHFFFSYNKVNGNSVPTWLIKYLPEAFLTPCDITDTECLRKSTQKFLAKTAKGVPEYDLRAIDPMVLPSVDHLVSEEYEVWNYLRNLTVLGLKNQDLSKFRSVFDFLSISIYIV